MERLDRTVQQDLRVWSVLLVLLVQQGLKGKRESRVQLAQQENPVLLGARVQVVLQAKQEQSVQEVMKVQMEQLVKQEQQETQVQLEQLVKLALTALQALRDQRESKVLKVQQDILVSLGLLVLLEKLDHLVM